ncbi:TolC family protein [Galbibacter pacificus]|uniref:TolC family protein n=1 Tax=Galbibacter pacificus TaxID=2996052 RepID=A0ABT6FR66_9FLAO|nr:TolC family protein [Galbibacter pacificus]MDG3581795.1 TolC family protein [Galbibacter pacificus]MDG3585731.1 TolC family protein [Galbibacter pacificus]
MKNLITSFIFIMVGFLVNAQTLNDYIDIALNNNPQIKAYNLKYNIAEEKTNESATLSNTEFGAGYFVSEPETRTGPQRFKLSTKQMLPWFGTITARENYANSLAESVYADIAVAKRKLSLSVAQSYYNLYALKTKQTVLQEQIELLKHYKQIALTGVEVGKTSAVKVLQLQIRENELEEQQKIFEQDFLGEQSRFNSLLNQPKEHQITIVEKLLIPTEAEEINIDSLYVHPELLKYDAMYASVTEAELLNQKSSGPNLGVGLDYINVAERTDMDMPDNGKDIVMPMVSVSIPIFNKSIRSKTIQNKLQQEQLLAEKNTKTNELESYLEIALKKRKAARISHETQIKNLNQAKNAEEILIKNYETETMNFNDLLDILELQLNFQLNKIEAEKNYYVQSATINYLTNK